MKLIQTITIGGAKLRLDELDDGSFEISVQVMPVPLAWKYHQLDAAKKAYDTLCQQMLEHQETMSYIKDKLYKK